MRMALRNIVNMVRSTVGLRCHRSKKLVPEEEKKVSLKRSPPPQALGPHRFGCPALLAATSGDRRQIVSLDYR